MWVAALDQKLKINFNVDPPMPSRTRSLLAAAGLLTVGTVPSAARAEKIFATESFEMSFSGYGEIGFSFYDHGADQTRQGGALKDRRLEFDTTRLVTELEMTLPIGIEVEAEVEFEHGGTGAAKEIEFEEFGEFESEIEKGGEVVVEELYIELDRDRFELKLGRFYVAVGQLSYYYQPTDYLGAVRSEAETTVIPAQWDEMGASFLMYLPRVRLTAQVVNGLDSSGFSSAFWVSTGHQGKFETIRATALAGVGRVDVDATRNLEVGVSGYVGGSSRNRPKPDLTRDCSDPDPDRVAPCDYIAGTVTIVDAHARWVGHGLRGQAWAMWGRLKNADLISERNDRLSNELDVPRTPIADHAIAGTVELGYDIAPHIGLNIGHKLEPFGRVEYIDTMYDVREGLFDNPRFERTIVGLGAAYTYKNAIVGKLDASRRSFGTSELRSESTVRATAGFVF
jgi:hypothetical protein